MNAGTKVRMQDLSRQKRFEFDVGGDLSPSHTVSQAVDHYLERMVIPNGNQRWTAYSRGLKLDDKQNLGELPEDRSQWTVIPEVSAGSV